MVRPTLEYASVVRDPIRPNQVHQIEMVQKRAARLITCDYDRSTSSTSLIHQLKLENIQSRRQENKVTMLYKIQNQLVKTLPPAGMMIPKSRSTHSNSSGFMRPSYRTKTATQAFYPSTNTLELVASKNY